MELSFSRSPINASYLVYKHNTIDVRIRWQPNLKGIAFSLPSNWTAYSQPGGAVETLSRQYDSGTKASLLPSRLRIEICPDNIATVWNIHRYQTSSPTGGPQSTSSWRFSEVMPSTNSSSL